MKIEDIKVIGVFGAGMMGHGIAQIMAQGGYKVFIRDISWELLDTALGQVKTSLQRFVERQRISQGEADKALSMITVTTDIEEAAKEADFIVEAIPEKPELQNELFKQLEAETRPTRGIGLGLVVCQRLVEAQGGWIKVDSAVGRGSTFSFALPIRRDKT